MTGETGRYDVVLACNEVPLVAADEEVGPEYQFVKQFVFINCNFPLQSDDFEDIPAHQGHSILTGGDIADGDILSREDGLIEGGPLADPIFVQFPAVEVQRVLSLVVVDDVALAVFDRR